MRSRRSESTYLRTGRKSATWSWGRRWSRARSLHWYSEQPWLVGVDYIPSTAVNQLEMWQASSFDPDRIDAELSWAKGIGLNVLRVFLHDLLWKQDRFGFLQRMETFLTIADRHGLRVVPVLFDSCWDPDPRTGSQDGPRPGICLSAWVQSPGRQALQDRSEYARLGAYVRGVTRTHADDHRILAWDIWNEPDHLPDSQTARAFGAREPIDKVELIEELLPTAFGWARESKPTQPLTSALWRGDWSTPDRFRPMERLQVGCSDVVSFHSYDPPKVFEEKVRELRRLGRPVLCTEYMARTEGSTIRGILPIARRYRVGALSWGLVAGKTQAYLPWDSWVDPYRGREPTKWFHDLLHPDGRPFDDAEIGLIRRLATAGGNPERANTPAMTSTGQLVPRGR